MGDKDFEEMAVPRDGEEQVVLVLSTQLGVNSESFAGSIRQDNRPGLRR